MGSMTISRNGAVNTTYATTHIHQLREFIGVLDDLSAQPLE